MQMWGRQTALLLSQLLLYAHTPLPSAVGAMDGGYGTPDHLRLSRLDRLIGELGQHQLSLRQQVRARF